jgi:hypothetical protein
MTSIKNYKPATVLVVIAALVGMLAASTVAIGSVRTALAADTSTKTVTIHDNNTGVNVQTDTNQKQNCVTAGSMSPLSGSCTAHSTNTVTESGGILKK